MDQNLKTTLSNFANKCKSLFASAEAIESMKDGENIDSFGDVEDALNTKLAIANISDGTYLLGHTLKYVIENQTYLRELLAGQGITLSDINQGNGGIRIDIDTSVIPLKASVDGQISELGTAIDGLIQALEVISTTLALKQDVLTAGNNISILNNIIKAFSDSISEVDGALRIENGLDVDCASGKIKAKDDVLEMLKTSTSQSGTGQTMMLLFNPDGTITLENYGSYGSKVINIIADTNYTPDNTQSSRINIKASTNGKGPCVITIESKEIKMKGAVDFDTIPTCSGNPLQVVRTMSNSSELDANTFNDLGVLEESVALSIPVVDGIVPEYRGQFIIDAEGSYSVAFPTGIIMSGDTNFVANGVYQFRICNGYGKVEKMA